MKFLKPTICAAIKKCQSAFFLSFPRLFLSFPRLFLSFPRRRESRAKNPGSPIGSGMTLMAMFFAFAPGAEAA